MIKLIKIKDPSSKWQLLSEFNPHKDCFIVSDIKTKLSIEFELLKKHDHLPGSCVLRASEFYEELLQTLKWEGMLVSDPFIKELFAEFCLKSDKIWIQNLKNSQSFLDFFKVFLTVWMHSEGSQLLQERLQGQKTDIFKSWFQLSQDFFNSLKSRNIFPESALKAILFNYTPSLESLKFPKDRIFFDLAFSFDLCEKEILQEISRHKEVCILGPELDHKGFFEKTWNAYQTLEECLSKDQIFSFDSYFLEISKVATQPIPPKEKTLSSLSQKVTGEKTQETLSTEKNIQNPNFKNSQSRKVFQVSSHTQIEEVCQAVSQIQKWVQAGVPQKDIALFAPYMENYWLALKPYFEREGLSAQKSITAPLSSFQEIRYFISALRLHLKKISFEDLEYFSFYKESRKNFSEFQSNYLIVPDRTMTENLLFKDKIQSPDQKMTGRQFIEWALSFWPRQADKILWNLVSKIFQNFYMEMELKAGAWLRLLESDILTKEKELEAEDLEGIACLSFNAFYSVNRPYIFIMGLNEESLKSPFSGILNSLSETQAHSFDSKDYPDHNKNPQNLNKESRSDFSKQILKNSNQDENSSSSNSQIFNLKNYQSNSKFKKTYPEQNILVFLQDIGFPLDLNDSKERENSLLWFLQSSSLKEIYLSCSSYNFSGDIQTKSLLYILAEDLFSAQKPEDSEEPLWNQHKKQKNLDDILKSIPLRKGTIDHLQEVFKVDLPSCFHPKKDIRLSVNSLKKYVDCPFKYAGDKLFFAPEKSMIDRELSPLSKGSIAHELFENVLKKYSDLELTEQQKEEIIEGLKPEKRELIYEKQWLIIKKYLKDLLDSFLEKEKDNRLKFPTLKPKAFEAEVSAFWNQKKGELVSKEEQADSKSKELYDFTGRVDRIDQDETNLSYVLRDYKSSGNKLTHISSWKNKGKEDLQMTLYVQALEKGLVKYSETSDSQNEEAYLPQHKVSSVFYSIYNDNFSVKGFEEKGAFEGKKKGIMGENVKGHQHSRETLQEAIQVANQLIQSSVQSMEKGLFSPKPKDKELCKKCAYKKWCRVESLVKDIGN